MASKPVYEIAQEHGVSTQELLQRLRAAGVKTEKSSFSLVDEAVAVALLESGRTSAEPTPPQGAIIWPAWAQRGPRRQRAQVPEQAPGRMGRATPDPQDRSTPVDPRARRDAPGDLRDEPAPAHEGEPRSPEPPPIDERSRHAPAQPPARPRREWYERQGDGRREQPSRLPEDPPPAVPRGPTDEPDRGGARPPYRESQPRVDRSPRPAARPRRPPPPRQVERPGRVERAPGPAAPQAQPYWSGQADRSPRRDDAATGSSFEQRRRLRQLRRVRDAELAKPGGQLLARRRDAEIRALEVSLGRHGPRSRSVRSMSIPAAIGAVVLIAGAFLLGGIRTGRENTRRVDSVAAAAPAFKNVVATARRPEVPIYLGQGDTSPLQTLASPNADGAPLAFLVKQRTRRWLEVALPTRPNGSTGWIRASDVALTGHDYRIRIDLLSHRLTVWNGSKRIARVAVGVGEAVTPTPSGQYYITELLKQPDGGGLYGPWAFGLSAHSDVLDEFAGADGILGIHGTDNPAGIGTDVSHGCIRMSNAHITRFARKVPVGTPVEITRV